MKCKQILRKIEDKYKNYIIKECKETRKTKIKIGVGKKYKYKIIKGDTLLPADKKSVDCIILIGNCKLIAVLVELKSRNIHPREVKEKFENTINFISHNFKTIFENSGIKNNICKIECVIFSKSWKKVPHYQSLKSEKIKIGAKSYRILLKEYKHSLKQILEIK